ncbi:uncharacterized protein SCHCODRAFT_02639237 [Schizophyllum commune H4-8]|uniref:uncharacterized protein n=1 Tax=Schizophyllum commune (strain H4-8 / FGSC 9210) TaxID=578458 RepID=UPI00215FBB8A|nr:uncharacterized protein SCHCODRAFT_02639237 [Schizophyllum commune H4-8]KAI5887918.1 hypothetical protein SCHCODRAFT_02639237 [Schizophyllum commune H4-8]
MSRQLLGLYSAPGILVIDLARGNILSRLGPSYTALLTRGHFFSVESSSRDFPSIRTNVAVSMEAVLDRCSRPC